MTVHHDLAGEFPEMKNDIHELKMTDAHFRHLSEKYAGICKELHRVLDGAGVIGDACAEDLKKQRLMLKDDLFQMLRTHQAARDAAAAA